MLKSGFSVALVAMFAAPFIAADFAIFTEIVQQIQDVIVILNRAGL
jgi:hypothetical protein